MSSRPPSDGMADPSAGFDAAGNFDALIPADPHLLLLSRVDPYGDEELAQQLMPDMIAEIGDLLNRARSGPELRGLLQLRALAEARAGAPDTILVFHGD